MVAGVPSCTAAYSDVPVVAGIQELPELSIDPLAITRSFSADLAANSGLQTNIVVPGASLVAAQQVRVRAVQETDVGGSSVIYQRTFAFPDVALPSSMVNVSANQLPLAGGLNSFLVQFFNRGYVPMDIIVARDNGAKPGDVYISVKNAQGQEVGRTTYTGAPPGATFLNDGRVYVRIPAQASLSFTVPQVLVAEALADTTVTFEAVAAKIYYRLAAADEQSSGPLAGSTTSGLAQTPYYGTAQTSQPGYANHEPVIDHCRKTLPADAGLIANRSGDSSSPQLTSRG